MANTVITDIPFSISSDKPTIVDGVLEILEHTAEALQHCWKKLQQEGLPIIFGHNTKAMPAGRAYDFYLDQGKMRAKRLEFFDTEEGEKATKLVNQGHREISIGYFRDKRQASYIDAGNFGCMGYRVSQWTPYEISILGAGADTSIGVNRMASSGNRQAEAAAVVTETPAAPAIEVKTEPPAVEEKKPDKVLGEKLAITGTVALNKPAVEVVVEAPAATPAATPTVEVVAGEQRAAQLTELAVERNNRRVAEILKLGERHGNTALAKKYIEQNKSVDDFRQELLEGMSLQSLALRSVAGQRSADMIPPEEAAKFSLFRLVKFLANPRPSEEEKRAAGFEMEVCNHAVQRAGGQHRHNNSLITRIPYEVLGTRAPITASTPGSGGYAVETRLSADFITQLRAALLTERAGVQTLTGLTGPLSFAGIASGSNASWLAAGSGTDAPEATVVFKGFTLTAKTAAITIPIYRDALQQTSVDMEGRITTELSDGTAEAINTAMLYGTGGIQPTGLANMTGIGTVTFAAAGAPTFGEIIDLESELGGKNVGSENTTYIISAKMRGHMKKTEAFSGTGERILQNGQVNDRPYLMTNLCADTDVFLVDFNQVLLGLFGDLDILVDPYTKGKAGTLEITIFQDVDVGAKYAEAVALGNGP